MREILDRAVAGSQLRAIDLHGALFLEKLSGRTCPELLLATSLVSHAVGEGHICLPLDTVAGKPVFTTDTSCKAPEIEVWRKQLLGSGVVGAPEDTTPLILDAADRLYLARYYRNERIIANDLSRRSIGIQPVDLEKAAALIQRLFPDSSGKDLQKMAVAIAALKKFVVISGGPGTGKTYTVARILVFLQALAEARMRIGLVAPTGKAAVRLQESIIAARSSLDDALASMVPVETKTLHRLLGFVPGSGTFRHNKTKKLHLDLLIIDEASMVDVPLMAALIEALHEKTRVIMLGDRDQLTSVEAGSLFGDICPQGELGWSNELCDNVQQLTGYAPEPVCSHSTFSDSVVLLKTSYRFHQKKGVATLAQAVNSEDKELVESMFKQSYEDLVLEQPKGSDSQLLLEKYILEGYRQCFTSHDPAEALGVLPRFRILCAVREGTNGVVDINNFAEKVLRGHKYIHGSDQWYRGRPLIIRRNHYGLQLFNGDAGVVWPDETGRLWAWFGRADGSLHQVPLSRLPEHDTAYAITVHQSQGSEFETVMFILPDGDSKVLCRELLYTAITRTRKSLRIIGELSVLQKGIENNVVRYSGLKEKLWKEEDSC